MGVGKAVMVSFMFLVGFLGINTVLSFVFPICNAIFFFFRCSMICINYMILRGKTEYKAEMSTSPVGNMIKLDNLFNNLNEKLNSGSS